MRVNKRRRQIISVPSPRKIQQQKHTRLIRKWRVRALCIYFIYSLAVCTPGNFHMNNSWLGARNARTLFFIYLGTALLISLAVIQTRENYRARIMLPSTAPNQPGECAPDGARGFSRSRLSPRESFLFTALGVLLLREGYIISAAPLWVASLPHGGLLLRPQETISRHYLWVFFTYIPSFGFMPQRHSHQTKPIQ